MTLCARRGAWGPDGAFVAVRAAHECDIARAARNFHSNAVPGLSRSTPMIVPWFTPSASVAKRGGTRDPIVMAGAGDPAQTDWLSFAQVVLDPVRFDLSGPLCCTAAMHVLTNV